MKKISACIYIFLFTFLIGCESERKICIFPVEKNQVLDIKSVKSYEDGRIVYLKGKILESKLHGFSERYQRLTDNKVSILLEYSLHSITPKLNQKVIICGITNHRKGVIDIDVLSYHKIK